MASCSEPVWLLGVKYADWEEEEVGRDEGSEAQIPAVTATPAATASTDPLSTHAEVSQDEHSQMGASEQVLPSSMPPASLQIPAQAAHLNGCESGEHGLHKSPNCRKSHSEWEEVGRDELGGEDNTPARRQQGAGPGKSDAEMVLSTSDAANDSATGGHWGTSSWMAARSALISGIEAIRQAQEHVQEHVQQQWQGVEIGSRAKGGGGVGEGGGWAEEPWSRVETVAAAAAAAALGEEHEQRQQQQQQQVCRPTEDAAARLLDDFHSRLWMTYRTGFPPLSTCTERQGPFRNDDIDGARPPVVTRAAATAAAAATGTGFAAAGGGCGGGAAAGLTSDLGWGCMFRTGQMMMAQVRGLQ